MDLFGLRAAGDPAADRWLGPALPDLSPALPDLSPALPDLSPALPQLSPARPDLGLAAAPVLPSWRWDGDREALMEILRAAGEPSFRSVADHDLVVAGQQPAVAGGPLYTLIKACASQRLADRLTAAGQPCRALFWVASEDHDLGEAHHVDLLQRDGRIARVACDLGGGRASLRYRPTMAWWDAVMASLHARLGIGLGTEWVLAMAPNENEGMGEWMARLLRTLVPGLLVVEGHVLRGLWSATAKRLTTEWPVAALNAELAALRAAGGSAPLGALPTPPWFRDDADARTPLTPAEALQLLARDPTRLSPGAALRPILQQMALPVRAFIAGPGEIAYHAQLGPVYAVAEATRPWLVPRPSVTVLPGWWRRGCRHIGADPAQIIAGQVPIESGDAVAAGLNSLAPAVERLRHQADPATAAALTRMLHDLERARRARLGSLRGDHPAPGALIAWARPRGRPQDRSLSILQAIWEWGPGFATSLAMAVAEDGAGPMHQLAV